MVVSCKFSLSSLSNLLKYENVRSSDAEDEGRNELVNKWLNYYVLTIKGVYDGGNCVILHTILLIEL